jgi:hypothetical protein
MTKRRSTAVSADEHKEREEGDEERSGEVEAHGADDEAEVEAHGGWGGVAGPEP